MEDDGDIYTVTTSPADLITVRKALQAAGFDYESAESALVPSVKVDLDFDTAKKVIKLIDALDDLDDVQNIYSNWTASPEVLQLLEDEE